MTLTDKLQSSPPSRRLDAEIWQYVDKPAFRKCWINARAFAPQGASDDELRKVSSRAVKRQAKRYTTSIDAALTLLPDGKNWTLQSAGGPSPMAYVDGNERFECGATPALALCIAILKARAE